MSLSPLKPFHSMNNGKISGSNHFSLKLDSRSFWQGQMELFWIYHVDYEFFSNLDHEIYSLCPIYVIINGNPSLNFTRYSSRRPPFYVLIYHLCWRLILWWYACQKSSVCFLVCVLTPHAPSSHLFLEDDSIVFWKVVLKQAGAIEKVLQDYVAISRKEVNFHKLAPIFLTNKCLTFVRLYH